MAQTNSAAAPSGFPTDLSTAVDFALSPEGDFIVGPNGDFYLVTGVDCLIQEVIFRLRTKKGDYKLEPECGASLDTLIGRPNSPEIENQIQNLITEALTHDNLFSEDNITITVWPEDSYTISILVICNLSGFTNVPAGTSTLTLPLKFHTQEGLLI